VPIVIASSLRTFEAVLVWDKLGGAYRPARGVTFDVEHPTTGEHLLSVQADGDGRVSFQSPVAPVRLRHGSFSQVINATA